jgi:hypothetical protein
MCRLQPRWPAAVRCHEGLRNLADGAKRWLMKTYLLRPFMTPATQSSSPAVGKPAVPPKQPLLSPVVDPTRPRLCLGLDVHLESIMAVAQRDHAGPQAPKKFAQTLRLGRLLHPRTDQQLHRQLSRRTQFRRETAHRLHRPDGPQGCALTPVRCARSAVALRQEWPSARSGPPLGAGAGAGRSPDTVSAATPGRTKFSLQEDRNTTKPLRKEGRKGKSF